MVFVFLGNAAVVLDIVNTLKFAFRKYCKKDKTLLSEMYAGIDLGAY